MGGVCVVLNQWHCHTDPPGYFQWPVESPVPRQVMLQVYKKYNSQYERMETTIALTSLRKLADRTKEKIVRPVPLTGIGACVWD